MWYPTNCPYAFHATINSRHYKVASNELADQPAMVAYCGNEPIGRAGRDKAWDSDSLFANIAAAKAICENHAREHDGRVDYGTSPVEVPVPFVTRTL